MFFNICIYRMSNPYNTIGCNNISQQHAFPFSYLLKDISGKTGLKSLIKCLPPKSLKTSLIKM